MADKFLLVVAVVAVVASAAAYADGTSGAPSGGAKDDPGNKIVCKTETVTGSHFTKRTCHTVREWETMRRAARETMERTNGKMPADAQGSNG